MSNSPDDVLTNLLRYPPPVSFLPISCPNTRIYVPLEQ
jgi:hypothetical protein